MRGTLPAVGHYRDEVKCGGDSGCFYKCVCVSERTHACVYCSVCGKNTVTVARGFLLKWHGDIAFVCVHMLSVVEIKTLATA